MKLTILIMVAAASSFARATEFLAVNYSDPGGSVKTSSLYHIDSATNAITVIGDTGLSRLNCLSTGVGLSLYTISSTDGVGYEINTSTGGVTALFDQSGMGSDDVRALAIGSGGWYALNQASPDNLYRIDPFTGSATLLGSTGVYGLQSLAFQPGTGVLYGVNLEPGESDKLGKLDTSTGEFTAIGGDLEVGIQTICFGPNGTLYGLMTGRVYTIDLMTGHLSAVTTGLSTAYDTRGAEVVPEPATSTAVLFGVGLLARRRRVAR